MTRLRRKPGIDLGFSLIALNWMAGTVKSLLFMFLVSSLITACVPSRKDEGTITVTNKTGEPVYNVYFKYKISKRRDSIGNLAPEASYTYTIKYSGTEDSITLHYTDKYQKFYTASVVAYSAQYDKQHVIFDIK